MVTVLRHEAVLRLVGSCGYFQNVVLHPELRFRLSSKLDPAISREVLEDRRGRISPQRFHPSSTLASITWTFATRTRRAVPSIIGELSRFVEESGRIIGRAAGVPKFASHRTFHG